MLRITIQRINAEYRAIVSVQVQGQSFFNISQSIFNRFETYCSSLFHPHLI